MKVSQLISVSVSNGTVVFNTKAIHADINVIGCSCTIVRKSVAVFDKNPIIVRPQTNSKVTVIGLSISYNIDSNICNTNVFIGIYRKDDTLTVDLDRSYTFIGGTISSGDRFQAVVTLEDGRKFAHYTANLQNNKYTPEGFQLVENIDLLFQFAAGVIDFQTLETYATGDNRSAQSMEIAGLKQRISLIEAELELKTVMIVDLRGELKRESDVSQGLYTNVSNQTKSIEGLRKTLEDTYSERNALARTVNRLEIETMNFKAKLRRIKRCVFGFWIPWFFPWGIVSSCRAIVGCYKDEELR